MFHVLNSGEMNVFRRRFAVTPVPATMYFACGLISGYPMAGSKPGGLNVFAAHPFVVFGLSASSTVRCTVRHAEVREPWIVSGCPVYARKAELNWNHSPGA
jgi:hypothetical protein